MPKNKLEELQIKIAEKQLANQEKVAELLKKKEERIKAAEERAKVEAEEKAKKQKEAKEAEEKAAREHEEWLAKQPDKCYVRTFKFADGTEKEYHSICDKKDYTREDRPNNALGLITGEYVRGLLKKDKIKETVDTIHLIEKKK